MCTRRSTLCLSVVILMIVGSGAIGQTTEELLAIRYAADQAVNAHDLDAQMAYWAEDCTYVFGALPTPFRGKEAIRSFFESLYAGIPDFTTTEGVAWAAGNTVVVEHVASGTQLGEWMGIPPTGRPIVLPHIDIYEFEGTKVKWAASFGDMAGVMMQLGVIPPAQMPELVPSYPIPEPEPTGLSPVAAAKQAQARFNAHDLPGHSRMQSEDDDIFIGAVGLPMNRDAWAAMQELYFAGFPDLQVFPTRFVDLGDGWVLSECTWAGTHNGPFFGIPATGAHTAVRGAMLYRYDAQGLEKAIHVYYDNLTVLNQILPAEPQPVNPGVQGLLAHYDFENDARDGSGNGYNGTLLGNAHVADGALVLDGTDDAVAVPRIGGAGAVFGQASYSLWVHPTVNPAPLDFSGGMNTNVWGAGAIHFKLRNGMVNVGISGLAGGDLQGKTVVAPNAWSHMALTVSDTAVSLYLNGHLEDSRTLAAPLTNLILGDAAIGAWNQNGTNIQRELTGFMDNVRIYGRALSAVEVLWLAGYRQNDPEANKVVARRFFEEMWNQRRLDIVDELITADMVGHAPTGEFSGYKGEMQTISGNLVSFPDLQITIDDIIAEGNKVALRTSYVGTHTGPLGPMPPTGKPIRMTGNIIFRFEDGKVAEAWSFADMLGLMQQLGAATPPRPSPEDYIWSAPSEAAGDPGDPEANKVIIQRFNDEVWNQRNLAVLEELFASEEIGHNPPIEYMFGLSNVEVLKQQVTTFQTAYPDVHVVVNDMVAEGDLVMERWTANATHLGELMGIPPTGRPVAYSGVTLYRFADGKIVEMWWAWDTMGMLRQITQP